MPNRNYNASGAPTFGGAGASAVIRAEFAEVAVGFAGLEAEIDQKVFAATAPSEWVNPARIETYISGTQFKWAGADATGIMTPHRRVRCTVNGAYVYSEVMSSAYASGYTTVNLLNPILTSQLTLVEYGVVSPLDQASSSMSLLGLQEVLSTFTDLGGTGYQCRIAFRYLYDDDGGRRVFALEPIPI